MKEGSALLVALALAAGIAYWSDHFRLGSWNQDVPGEPAFPHQAPPHRVSAPVEQTAPERLEIYYCAGRQQHFGEQSTLELETLFSHSGAHDLVGALSLGEIGSLRPGDYPLFHNGAILCNGEGSR